MDKFKKNTLTQNVDKLASQCVKCALCLPHCPTYELTQDENESPRGRIALFQALAQEKLPLTAKVKSHLDLCLGCRACERVCPAHVEYGKLLIEGRHLLQEMPKAEKISQPSTMLHLLNSMLTQTKWRKSLHWLLWVLQKSGLRHFAKAVGLTKLLHLASWDEVLPEITKPFGFSPLYPALGEKRGKVMLFTGCVSSLCDQEALLDSIYVLRCLGMEVHIPSHQACCGAMALHAGQFDAAQQLAEQNCHAFNNESSEFDYLITTATGCSAVLQEYGENFSSNTNSNQQMTAFSSKVIDIMSFILKCTWPEAITLKPLPLRVILHTPCTRRNVLKTPSDVEKLLSQIPQLSHHAFVSPHCCGAAGTYMLEHPQIAAPLAQKLLSELDNIQAECLVTTNIGCALHLKNHLKNHPAIKIQHPITLLAKSIGYENH